MSADVFPGLWPGEAEEPERLRDPSRADASEDEPITYDGTIPFIAGDDKWDGFVDVADPLGDDSRWWVGSRFSIPLMGGSSKKPEPFC